MRSLRTIGFWLVLAVTVSRPSLAATIIAGDVAALITAINTANGNGQDDMIVLTSGGTYSLTAANNGQTGLPVVTTRITIQGNGATIQRTGAPEFRLFDVAGTGDLTLDHVTVKGGQVTFNGLPSTDGGAGIRVLGAGKLTLTGSTVTENDCLGNVCQGGGLLAFDNLQPVITITDSTISNNFSVQGGGMDLRHNDQTLVITRSVFSGNTGIEGGGLATNGQDTVTITDSTFSGNGVSDLVPGGALGAGILDIGGATWTISGTTFVGNTVTGNGNGGSTNYYGGAMGENGGATITMTNCTITGNSVSNTGTAFGAGGGLFGEGGGTWTLNNVTITENTVTGQHPSGGGFELTRGTATLRNTILAGNTAATNPDCSDMGGTFSTFTSDGHNLFGDTTGCNLTTTTGDLVGMPPLLAALANNGGPTMTRALQPLSPALDVGDPGAAGSPTACAAVDQRGIVRPQGSGCDIGAFELEVGGTTTTTTTAAPTTTTTLAGDCVPRAATFVNIDCRLDLLVARVTAATDLGRLERGLEGAITKARDKKVQAEGFDAAGKRKPARNALKKAVRRMTGFIHKIKSLSGRKVIPSATSSALLADGDPILADMKTLSKTLPK